MSPKSISVSGVLWATRSHSIEYTTVPAKNQPNHFHTTFTCSPTTITSSSEQML